MATEKPAAEKPAAERPATVRVAGRDLPTGRIAPTAEGPATPWTWPVPPLTHRYNQAITEVFDLAADGRRVAVIEGALWPPVGTPISLHEDEGHLRRGVVDRVELALESRRPATVKLYVALEREAIGG